MISMEIAFGQICVLADYLDHRHLTPISPVITITVKLLLSYKLNAFGILVMIVSSGEHTGIDVLM